MKLSLLILAIIFALAIPPTYMFLKEAPDNWTFFIIVLGSALMVNGASIILLRGVLKNLFFQYFYFILGLLSLAWLFVYHLLAENTRNPYGGFNLPYDQDPIRYFVICLMPALAAWLLFPLLLFINQHIAYSHQQQRTETDRMRRAVVWVFLVFNVLYLVGNFNVEIPILFYFGRVGHNTSLLFLFWVAYWNRKLGILFYLTIGIMITIAVFEVLAGSRYGPMMTLLLLFLGFFFGSKGKARIRMAWFGLALLPFTIVAAGYLEKVRMLIGRGGIEDVSAERIELIQKAITRLDRVEGVLGNKESAFVSGIARNVNWVDMAVITTTNNKIPFRGGQNIKTELSNIFSLALFSAGTKRENIDEARLGKYDLGLGTGPARKYGFVVDESTSVEWSLLADSFSRGGLWVYLVYLLIFFSVFAIIEMIINVSNQNRAEQKLLVCIFLDIILKSMSLPLYETFRAVMLNSVFYIGVILLTRVLAIKKAK